MGITSRLKGAIRELRGSPSDPIFWQEFNQFLTLSASGKIVNADTAMKQATVYACVKVLSETMASLPISLYKRRGNGSKTEATNHALYNLLHSQPNPAWSKFEFWEYLTASILLRGDAYVWIETDNGGSPRGLWPLSASHMTFDIGINEKGARRIVEYKYTIPEKGTPVTFRPDEIWHAKDMIGPDGVSGMSRITQARDTIGLAVAADEYGNKFFANDATPGGVLKYSGTLSEDAQKGFIESWNEIHKSGGNSFKTAFLQGGIEFTPITMKNEDSQFIQTRAFQVADIARIFRVPTILIGGAGDADKSNTFASAEQQMLSFVQNTIRPWAVRLENSMSSNLLNASDRVNHFAEFKLEGLLRGDIKTRFEAYRIGREIGILSVDDVRVIENMEPLGDSMGGTKYIVPMNFQPLIEEEKTEGDLSVDPMTALNGAQVTSMVQVVQSVADGVMPKETAIQILFNSFPLDEDTARAIIDPIEEKEPEEPEPPVMEGPDEPSADDEGDEPDADGEGGGDGDGQGATDGDDN